MENISLHIVLQNYKCANILFQQKYPLLYILSLFLVTETIQTQYVESCKNMNPTSTIHIKINRTYIMFFIWFICRYMIQTKLCQYFCSWL